MPAQCSGNYQPGANVFDFSSDSVLHSQCDTWARPLPSLGLNFPIYKIKGVGLEHSFLLCSRTPLGPAAVSCVGGGRRVGKGTLNPVISPSILSWSVLCESERPGFIRKTNLRTTGVGTLMASSSVCLIIRCLLFFGGLRTRHCARGWGNQNPQAGFLAPEGLCTMRKSDKFTVQPASLPWFAVYAALNPRK